MSDSTDASAAGTPEEAPKPALPEAVNLQNSVKERLDESERGDRSVRERVVEALVEEELERRAGVLSAALVRRKDAEAALRKIKPDQTTFAADGTETSVFSKEKFQERKKAQERLTKLDAAIDKVIAEPSAEAYKKLGDLK